MAGARFKLFLAASKRRVKGVDIISLLLQREKYIKCCFSSFSETLCLCASIELEVSLNMHGGRQFCDLKAVLLPSSNLI